MIYRLKFDRANHMLFDITLHEIQAKFGNIFALHEPQWADFWVSLDASFSDESDNGCALKLPDISTWISDNLVLSESTKAELDSHLQPYGELLPVNAEGNRWWILHVTQKTGMEAIDESKSQRIVEEGGYKDVHKLTFKDDWVSDFLLFKSEYNDYKSLYCNQTFKDLVEGLGLQGLLFDTDLASIF